MHKLNPAPKKHCSPIIAPLRNLSNRPAFNAVHLETSYPSYFNRPPKFGLQNLHSSGSNVAYSVFFTVMYELPPPLLTPTKKNTTSIRDYRPVHNLFD